MGVIAGVLVGLLLSSTDGNAFSRAILNIVVTLKYILNQIINFCIPLIIIAFIAPSITQMGKNASKLLLIAVTIAYTSSVELNSSPTRTPAITPTSNLNGRLRKILFFFI